MGNRDAIDFRNTPVGIIFRRLLMPTLIGTLSITAVTAVDGIFVGRGVGSMGVAAVNITAPIFMLFSGFGLMAATGCSVVSAIHLSHNNYKAARLNVTQAIIFTTIIAVIICMAAMLAPNFIVRLLGASDSLMPMSSEYLFWIIPGCIGQMWSFIGLFAIRLDGAPKYAMWCNLISAFLNVILDWLLIFPLGLGVKGAAIATAISMLTGGLMALFYLIYGARTLRLRMPKLSKKSLMLTLRNIKYQCHVGSSSMLGELTIAVLLLTGNVVFIHYLGDDGVAAFGVACYYTPFFFCIGNAIAQSAQPIISFGYGEARWETVIRARKLLLITALVSGILLTIPFILFPRQLVALFFNPYSHAGCLAVEGLPLYAIGATFFIVNVAVIGYLQSVERIRESTVFALLRGAILLVPCFIVFPILIGTSGIWLAMPIAEIGTLLIIVIYMRIIKHAR